MRRALVMMIAAVTVGVTGCMSEYNLATHREETYLYGTDKEIKVGDSVARQLESHFPIDSEVEANQRVQRILERIVAVCDRKELVYTVKIIDEDKLNAVSLPGGYIYVYKGLIDKVDNDDELAGVIAHEVGHIAARHAMKRLETSMGYAVMQVLAVQSGSPALAQGVQTAYLAMFVGYSQEDEFLADKLGVKYMRVAGYDPEKMASMLHKLHANEQKEPLREFSYWRTHPYIPQRIANVNREITGELHFKDYLNLIGNE